ncbi:LLM class flavin-dependent oxidoreductase [Paenibacillus mucilaginosus]|uniref:LLM class flavin-dependent oxidoreductase n=1 Tax=Paenibacillus mucilaginosus TaxID=61624 RepID=UPI00240E49CE|nr:LLM class flavin-dependent oxidoreductase [Paenibacillus mucilaginosus]WFA21661.1 LLM class flavin-dependent oxidoreductase [Paenibacillus mucilaginosus]
MKLSVLDLVPVLQGADNAGALGQALRLARTAETLGYHRYWAAEHHDLPGLACTAPEVLLAHIGAQTQSIRLGTGALLLPHYKAMKVAETFHMLAALYPGRIDLGLGRAPGGSAHAAIALSGNFLEGVRQLPDTLRSLLQLLEGTFRVENEPVTARPMPGIPPEVWLLGTNRKSAELAAEHGTGYVFGQFMSDQDAGQTLDAYRQAYRPSGRAPRPRSIVAVGVVCAETEVEARRLAAEGRKAFRPEAGEAGRAQTEAGGRLAGEGAEASGAERPAGLEAPGEPEAAEGRRLLAGTPQQVKARLEAMAAEYGVDEFLVVTPVSHYGQRLRSYELLAQAVLT